MILIQVTEFLARKDIQCTFDKFYRNKHGFCMVKKEIFSGDYSVYAVARTASAGEMIPTEHAIDLEEQSDKYVLKIIGSSPLSTFPVVS